MVSREISVQNQGVGRKFMQEDLHLLLKSNAINIQSSHQPYREGRSIPLCRNRVSECPHPQATK